MFLRGERVAQISETALVWEGPLTDIHQGALRLPEPYASCTEAALDLHVPHTSTRMVFIAGERCLDWEWGVGQKFEGLVTDLPGFGPHLPAEYRSDVDAVMQVAGNPWKTLLIKGERCALLVWGRGVEYEGPLIGRGEAGWKLLPAHMRGDFDDALMLYAGGNNRTVFIKGDQAMDFHWIDGPTKIGTWAQVLPGLGALPAAYRTPRLPAAGRFSGTADGERIDLRIDLTGALPVISGDTFDVADDAYVNSFVLQGNQAVTLPATVSGTATFANPTQMPKISVQVDKLAPGGTAVLTRSTADETGSTTTYTCTYVSRFLRTIDWEVDAMAGTKPAAQYATTTHPRPTGLAKKIITVQSAFAEAGIELRTAGTVVNEIGVQEAGADLRWSNAELHAAMESNFSGHRNTEQWKLWSFIATRHVDDDGTQGVMFDREGSPRQGMAMFHTEMVRQQVAGTRTELHTWVHELGHAFNLVHSWQKNIAKPPQPLGPRNGYGDLSWMNYEANYQGPNGEAGEDAFWAAFTHQFTANELRHLRHGFYRNVVMGGLGLEAGVGGAYRLPLKEFALPPASRSGLRLELYGRESFSHGEPVVTEIKLSLDGSTGQADAFPNLSPRGENLTILVTDPAGDIHPFRPIARHCGNPDRRVTLDAATPALYDSAYIGYGADGLTFPTPGTYRLRALCRVPDGSTVVSAERTIQISPPHNEQDRQAGDLLMGSQQGTLLALLGSDAPQLAEGNAALDELITTHPDHPLAVYAHMVKGTNAGRHFQTLGKNGITVRPADTATSIEQLGAVVETTLDTGTDAGVDNITLNEAMRRLARAHARAGDLKQADTVLDQLVDTFRDKDVPPPVLATIAEQAETTRTQLHDQA
ncbi:M12 family metallo-peptidase [Nonomuraea sp. NPDC049607]|uniref:M12 family metallo-peptidase n=1 Tax=Nonomuraea sp. NPDC049607 TaxID=3154732 RepID=UPI00342C1E9A